MLLLHSVRRTLALLIILSLMGCSLSGKRPVESEIPSLPEPIGDEPVAAIPLPGKPTETSPQPAPDPLDCSSWGWSGELPYASVRSAFTWQESHRDVCEATVETGAVDVHFWLPLTIDERVARDALHYTGSGTPAVHLERLPQQAILTVRLPAVMGGEKAVLSLQGPLGPRGEESKLGFKLDRRSLPLLEAQWQEEGGAWQSLASGSTLPLGSVNLRFRGDSGLLHKVRREAERTGLPIAADAAGSAATASTAEWLVLKLRTPPERLSFDFHDGGRHAPAGFQWTVYFGARPRLVALDPASGNERQITEVPVDLLSGSVSPGGRHAVLTGLAPDLWWDSSVWVVDIETGQLVLTPFRSGVWPVPVAWREDRFALPLAGHLQVWDLESGTPAIQVYPAGHWGAASPDGRVLPGFRWDPMAGLAPGSTSIILYDVDTGIGKVFPDLIGRFVKPGHGPPLSPFRWTPDGRLLVEEHIGYDEEKRAMTARWLELNLQTGVMTPVSGPESTDTTLLIGPDGWQVHSQVDWGPITLQTPAGAEVSQGEGLILGWTSEGTLLIIRWPNAPYRRGLQLPY